MRFQVMRLAITLQFSKMTKNGAKHHIVMKKKSLKLSETSKRIDFWKNCRAPIVCFNGYFWMYFMTTFT